MYLLLVSLHVVVCLFLIFVVLLQSAQAADLAGAFGGGGSQTALGMRGATTLLQKATTVAAVLFMITSLTLGIMGRRTSSLIEGVEGTAPAPIEAPEGGEAPSGDEQQPAAGAEAGESEQQPAAPGEQAQGEPGEVPPAGQTPAGERQN